jgi:cysteine-rich repeat protein
VLASCGDRPLSLPNDAGREPPGAGGVWGGGEPIGHVAAAPESVAPDAAAPDLTITFPLPPPEGTAACGDGNLTGGETCDDGNTRDGDGCNRFCQREECGNRRLDLGETCDDGNAQAGDGCSALCQVDPGYICTIRFQEDLGSFSSCAPICGDRLIVRGEVCDDGNARGGDGCAADCAYVEAGYVCPNRQGPGGPCVGANRCGDGHVDPDESCDDGNRSGADGCSALCLVEPGFRCASRVTNEDLPHKSVCWTLCGDGIVQRESGEECDGTPGCSPECKVRLIE